MKFGIFYELQLPRPWTRHSEHHLVQDALIQAELADRLGYDYIWEVEHHFLEEYSHSSAPEVFLAAASQRTRHIRLGHGIVQVPTNHPARVAERVAMLDLVSNGRVELGLGEGSSVTELHPFDRRFRDKRKVFEDGVRCILPMFWNEGWEYHGEIFDFPLRNVVPKPLQEPHPPLWVACSQFNTILDAGRWGMGALGFQFVSADRAKEWINGYYHEFLHNRQQLTDYRPNPNFALVCGFMCAETDEEARRKAEGWTFFQFSLLFYNRHGPVAPGTVDLWQEYLKWKDTEEGQKAARAPGALIGSPDTIRAELEKYHDAHVDQIILLNQAGKTSHKDICDSLELFAKEVMHDFQLNDSNHLEWKRAMLAGEIPLEPVNYEAFNVPTTQTPTKKQAAGE